MQNVLFAILCLILFSPDLWAGEKLLYAIRYESLQRYPDIVNTKIFSLDPGRSESRLIFSDEKAGVMLLPKRGMPGHPGDVLVCSRNRIFSHAVEKRLNPGRWYPYKASIFELSTDGSNKFREILNMIGVSRDNILGQRIVIHPGLVTIDAGLSPYCSRSRPGFYDSHHDKN